MMLIIALIVPPIIWVGVAWLLGVKVYRLMHRRSMSRPVTLAAALVVALLFIGLPFWDLAPGLLLYSQAVAEKGGLRVYRTAQVDGYLDRLLDDCTDCWIALLEPEPYSYVEVETSSSPKWSLDSTRSQRGFYQFSLAGPGSAECTRFDAWPGAAVQRQRHPLGARCPVFVRRDEPVSRYERAINLRVPYREWFPFVTFDEETVRDIQTGERLAEAYRIHYRPWFAVSVGLPGGWHYDTGPDGKYIEVRPRTALQPTGDDASEIR